MSNEEDLKKFIENIKKDVKEGSKFYSDEADCVCDILDGYFIYYDDELYLKLIHYFEKYFINVDLYFFKFEFGNNISQTLLRIAYAYTYNYIIEYINGEEFKEVVE